jgi:hypothetical protein
MRRAVARGRIVPQSLSTDPRYGRLSLKAQVLYPLMWINADDQGRLSGDPDEIKYAACPSVKEIATEEIPTLLHQMGTVGMIKVYSTLTTEAVQMLDWWAVQKLQWAYPSEYPPPEGWTDRLRYHRTPKEIITENWVLPSALPSVLPSALQSSPLTTPSEKEIEKEKEGGRRNLPSALGSKTTTTTPQEEKTTGEEIPRSRLEAEETLCEGDREIISVWCSVKGFEMTLADASALVARLRTEFPDVDILDESKTWAARKLTEPLEKDSRPSQQIWNFMRLARKYTHERREREQDKGKRAKVHPHEAYRGKW